MINTSASFLSAIGLVACLTSCLASSDGSVRDMHAHIKVLQPQSCAKEASVFTGTGTVLTEDLEYSSHVCFDDHGSADGIFLTSTGTTHFVSYHIHCAARDKMGGLYFGAEVDFMSDSMAEATQNLRSNEDASSQSHRLLKSEKKSLLKSEKKSLLKSGKKSKATSTKKGKSSQSSKSSTPSPSSGASNEPSVTASENPSESPSSGPSNEPSVTASQNPSESPSSGPSNEPSVTASQNPSAEPPTGCDDRVRKLEEEHGLEFQHARGLASSRPVSPQGTLAILYIEEDGKDDLFKIHLFAKFDHTCAGFVDQTKEFSFKEDEVGRFLSGSFAIKASTRG